MAATVAAAEWLERARALKDEGWWLADLCGLDCLGLPTEARFHIVVQLLHEERRERQTLHIEAAGEPPAVPSVVG
jgi:NADH:ubiquinone oxidoreductase subunit C